MNNVSESVKTMKTRFMQLHQDGYSIPKIADESRLSSSTVYRYLQDIADENHVTREELLSVSHNGYNRTAAQKESRVKLDISELEEGFAKVEEEINGLIEKIDDILEEEEC